MKWKIFGFAAAIVVGVSLVAVAPASALACIQCTCSTPCYQVCLHGPKVPGCPSCSESTCGEWGTCVGTCGGASTANVFSAGGDVLNGAADSACLGAEDDADTDHDDAVGNAGDDAQPAPDTDHGTAQRGSEDDGTSATGEPLER